MKFFKQILPLLLLLWLLPKAYAQTAPSPAPTSRLARIVRSGVLRLGVPGDYAPFAIARGDSLSGADITLGRALASAIGVRAVFIKTSWPGLAADMRSGAFDIALGGISITPERAALADFSTPYHHGGKTFICRRADSARFADSAAVNKPGVRLIVNKGGTNESVARALCPRAILVVYPDNIGVFNEVISGRADVMITDDIEADLKALQYPQLSRSYAGTITKSDKALWVQPDTALLAYVNSWLQKEIAAGLTQQWLKEAILSGR